MSLFYASLGTVLGSVYFILGGFKPLIVSLVLFISSSMVFTTMKHRRKEMMSLFVFFLLVFINFNLRSELVEYQNFEIVKDAQYIVVSEGKERYFKQELVIEKQVKNPITSIFKPQRLLINTPSHFGLVKNDIISFLENPELQRLKSFKAKKHKVDKCFYEAKINEDSIIYLDHKTSFFEGLRQKVLQYYNKNLDDKDSKIIQALLLGSRGINLDKDFIQAVRDLGLGHFFAASGFHLMVLTFIFSWIFRLLKFSRLTNTILLTLISFSYMGITNFSPSIVRAGSFIISYLFLNLFRRKAMSLRFLIILAGIFLFINPYMVYDLGFQLSYIATISIVIWNKTISEKLNYLPSYLKDIVSVTLSSQILLLPVICYYFDTLQIWSLMANIVLSPLLSLLTMTSFLGMTFIINPILSVFEYLLKLSRNLPLIDTHIEVNLTSLVISLLLTNFIAVLIFKPKLIQEDEKIDLFEAKRKPDENIFNAARIALNSNAMLLSLILSACLMLVAVNIRPLGIKKYIVRNAEIVNSKFTGDDVEYFNLEGYKALIIRNRDFATISTKLYELQEVSFLFLPKLNAKDTYLKTIVDIIKPQFIICSIDSKSKRAQVNLDTISRMANTIVDSGTIYISKGKYWKITNE